MLVVSSAKRTGAGVPAATTYDGVAELPRVTVSTTFPTVTGATRIVSNQTEWDTEIAAAVGGDEIVLDASFTGTLGSFPARAENGWILVRSDNAAWQSASSTRVSDGTNMRAVTAAGSPLRALDTGTAAAHHYYFCGIEFKFPTTGNISTELIELGTGAETSTSQLPHHFVFDRCYIHGDLTDGGYRGMTLNAYDVALINCRVTDFWETGGESKALLAFNTPGPMLFHNNYLEAASVNVMFGGSDPTIDGCIPSDITFTQNHVIKRAAWNNTGLAIKNHFEIKNGQRVLVEKNLFENMYTEAQDFSINLKSVNQGSSGGDGAPWCTCADVVFRHNYIKNCDNAITVIGDASEGGLVAVPTTRIRIRNNLVQVTQSDGGDGYYLQLGSGNYCSIVKNTFIGTAGTARGVGYATATNGSYHVMQDNIFDYNTLGVKGSGGQNEGTDSLNAYSAGTYTFSYNAVTGRSAASASYPANNIFPANSAALSMTNYAGADYSLNGGPCSGTGSDSGDMGCDATTVAAYAATAAAGS